MPLLFTCPHCQTQTQVEDRYSGQSGQCAVCGKPIQIPQFRSGTAPQSKPRSNPLAWGIAAAVALVLAGCLIYSVLQFGSSTITRLSNNSIQTKSSSNVRKIAAALNAYAQKHGTYPPPVLMDKANKKPLLSWRVLILKELGHEELYERFDLTKSWDDSVNMQLTYEMPDVYRHPNTQVYGNEANYFLVTGVGTLFPPSGPMDPANITDKPDQTILVIEGQPSPIGFTWTEPLDLNFGMMTGQINGTSNDDPGKLIESGAVMATVDERSHFLPNSTSVTTINALLTPAGGEPLADDTLD